jgi:hypothetical protein
MKDEDYIVNEDLIQIGDKLFILNWEIKNKDDYKYRVKNSKGQIVELEIWVYYSDREQLTEYLSVTLSVNKKRKGYEYGKETGKAGIESLLIAKKILQYHIDKVLKRQRVYKWTYYIIIWWDDSRRRDIYYRGLKDLGFEFSQYGNKEWNS